MPGRFPARLVEDLWRLRCSTGWAHGSIWTHARGFELRILWNGALAWTGVRAELAASQDDARTARRRLEREGRAALATLAGPPSPGSPPNKPRKPSRE